MLKTWFSKSSSRDIETVLRAEADCPADWMSCFVAVGKSEEKKLMRTEKNILISV